MAGSNFPQGMPVPVAPFTEPETGRLVPQAYRLILSLINRTGGAQGSNPSNYLQTANNLSDLDSIAAALEHLGLAVGGIVQVDHLGNVSKLGIGSGLSYDGHTLSVGVVAKPITGSAVIAGPGYMFSSSGAATVVNADATVSDPTNPAYAPCNCWIQAASVGGQIITVLRPGQYVPGLILSPGATYWLDASPGGYVTTPPSTPGNGNQLLGTADETGKLFFERQPMLGV